MVKKIDEIDIQILGLLQENSKINTKEIALKIGLSLTPTFERIKKLEKKGIIDNYTININNHNLGLQLEAFCQVTLNTHIKESIIKFEKEIEKIPEISECYHLTGNYDYLLKITIKDINHFKSVIIDKLTSINVIANMHSSFVMKKVKNKITIPQKNTFYPIL
ncbi:MAG: Lrp/AsnC family transcriptional regulator [Flavobacteriaceae bacterium]|nr:Lrp/AsnC family transcriptional regulator [Flavobacteriaceae bacterium]